VLNGRSRSAPNESVHDLIEIKYEEIKGYFFLHAIFCRMAVVSRRDAMSWDLGVLNPA
jgi:hypothetical protein